MNEQTRCWMFLLRALLLGLALGAMALAAHAQPIGVERLSLPGPVQAVLVRVDLTDPTLQVAVLPAGEVLPSVVSGNSATATLVRLATVRQAAERHDLDVAVNASFFGVQERRKVGSRDVAYFVGNPGFAVGWHLSSGQLHASPRSKQLRHTLVLHASGRASVQANLDSLPADALHAVSGNAVLLQAGAVVPEPPAEGKPPALAPRTAAGVANDGNTLLLLAVDGRAPGHSIGLGLHGLAELLKAQGATDAINLDGGGSTSLVLRDALTGAHSVVNKASDPLSFPGASGLSAGVERPVVDVIGVRRVKPP